MNDNLDSAYKEAILFASSHYENFPVVSLSLPSEIRKHIAVVYQFARQADDIADEGDANEELRTKNLELYEKNLSDCLNEKFSDTFWRALHYSITKKNLSTKNFYDLISAFKQDVTKKRYVNFTELLDYCKRSANPVGRIILELYNIRNEEAIRCSDSICTALQLTNFYQDVSVDFLKRRIYLPKEEMEKFGINEKIFDSRQINTNFKQLMKFQIDRTRKLFDEGKLLLIYLPVSLKRQIRMTILGGMKILDKIEQVDYDVLSHRPKLSKLDYLKLFLKAF